MANLKLFYSREELTWSEVWLGQRGPVKARTGEWVGANGSKVTRILPACGLSHNKSKHLLKLLRPKGIKKGQCWEITVKAEKKRKNKP